MIRQLREHLANQSVLGPWLVVVALVVVAATTFRQPNSDGEIVALAIAVPVLSIGAFMMLGTPWDVADLRLPVAVGALAVVGLQAAPDAVNFFSVSVFAMTSGAVVVVAIALLVLRQPSRLMSLGLVGLLLLVAVISSIQLIEHETIPIDVTQLHDQAVDALVDGRNPYTTGNVSVRETLPRGDLDLIEEYTYTPVNLAWYAAGRALTGDVRAGGAIAIVVSLVMLGSAVLILPTSSRAGPTIIAGMAFLLANQSTYLMISFGWTEAVALPFFIAVALLWTRYPIASAVILGLGVASKQYFVLVIPLVFAMPVADRWRRGSVVVVTAALTAVPFLAWDAGGFIDGTIVHHLTRDPRPDSATIAGFDILVPTGLAVLCAVALGIACIRRAADAGGLVISVAVLLSWFTLLAVRGFVNSWWMVYVLGAVALTVPALSHQTTDESQAQVPRQRTDTVIE